MGGGVDHRVRRARPTQPKRELKRAEVEEMNCLWWWRRGRQALSAAAGVRAPGLGLEPVAQTGGPMGVWHGTQHV